MEFDVLQQDNESMNSKLVDIEAKYAELGATHDILNKI